MPLHPELTEKSLQLPKAPDNEARLKKEQLAFFTTFYKVPPSYNWINKSRWQTSPFFIQLLDQLLPAYEQLSTLYGVDPKGFLLFVRKFKGGSSIYDFNHLDASPDPYHKPPIVYESIKDYLEKIYYTLTTTSSMGPQEIRKHLAFLSQQLAFCGPGVVSTLQTIYEDVNQKDGIPYWLEKTRDTIASCIAAELFEKRIKPRERRRDSNYNETWFDENYRAHAHAFVERLAQTCGFTLFKSELLMTFHDQYEKGLNITEADRQWVVEQLYQRYTPSLIIESLSTTLSGRLSEFKEKNLKCTEIEKAFLELIYPFIKLQIFSLEDITTELDNERVLNPDVHAKLSTYCRQLMHKSAFFKYPGIICIEQMIDLLKTQYINKLSETEQHSPNRKRLDTIEDIQTALSAILINTDLSDDDKVNAANGLLQNCIDNINAEHNIIRQWFKRPLRFLQFPIFETRLEALLNTFLNKLKPRTLANTKPFYLGLRSLIKQQSNIIHQNKLAAERCHRLIQDNDEIKLNQSMRSLNALIFSKDAFGEYAFFTKIDDPRILFSFPTQEEILEILNEQAIFWKQKGAIYLKSNMIDQYSVRYEHLIDSKKITASDFDYEELTQQLKLRRLLSMTAGDRLVLHSSLKTSEAIRGILQLDICLLTNNPEPLLNLIQAKHLTPTNIRLLNAHIRQTDSQKKLRRQLQFVLRQDIDLSLLPLLSTLEEVYFTPDAQVVFDSLFLLPREQQIEFITILNQCMQKQPDTKLPLVLSFLSEPQLNIAKLPSLIGFQDELYTIDGSIKLLCQFQALLPEREENFITLINILKPTFQFISGMTPQDIRKIKRDGLVHAVKKLTDLLILLPPSTLLEQGIIDKIRSCKDAQYENIIAEIRENGTVIKTLRYEAAHPANPTETAPSGQASSHTFFSIQPIPKSLKAPVQRQETRCLSPRIGPQQV